MRSFMFLKFLGCGGHMITELARLHRIVADKVVPLESDVGRKYKITDLTDNRLCGLIHVCGFLLFFPLSLSSASGASFESPCSVD